VIHVHWFVHKFPGLSVANTLKSQLLMECRFSLFNFSHTRFGHMCHSSSGAVQSASTAKNLSSYRIGYLKLLYPRTSGLTRW